MDDADGGDGSVRVDGHEEVELSVAGAGEEHGQDSASSSQEHAEGDGRESKRGFSNSTSGKWNSTASWGDWDCSWEEDIGVTNGGVVDGADGALGGKALGMKTSPGTMTTTRTKTGTTGPTIPGPRPGRRSRKMTERSGMTAIVNTIETATGDRETELPRQMVERNGDLGATD